MSRPSRDIVFSAGIIIFLLFGTPGFSAETLQGVFQKLDFSLSGIEDFTVQKDITRDEGKSVSHTVIAQKADVITKIEITENIAPEEARRYIDERKYILESLYKRLPNPYPGMITNTIECPDAFKPGTLEVNIRGTPVPVYVLNSTPRFTYGACVDELIQYRGTLVFVYDESRRTLFRIELFYPKERFDKENALAILKSFVSGKKEREEWNDCRGCNLIIIGFDPLGANHVGLYGYRRDTMPCLDAFARGEWVFKNAVSPSSWTLPVFMSWFTSLYPSQHKIVNKYSVFTEKEQILANLQQLSPGTVTLAQILKNNGYATAGFTGDAGVEAVFGYSQGFDEYYDKATFGGFDIVFPKAIQWLTRHKNGKFFLFIQGYDVHGRYKYKGDFQSRFADAGYKGKYRGTPEEYWQLRNESLEDKPFILSPADVSFWRNWYDGKIYEADRNLGLFLEKLKELGLWDKTIILISSASGNEFCEHGRFDHGYSLYDELIRVPLVMRIPGVRGRAIENQVRTIDIMPTLLDILRVAYDEKTDRQMQGVSLVPLMKGKALELDAFSETDYLLHSFKRSLRSSDGWKFIYSMENEQKELYNLKEDPGELNNRAEKETEKAYEMEQKLLRWIKMVKQ